MSEQALINLKRTVDTHRDSSCNPDDALGQRTAVRTEQGHAQRLLRKVLRGSMSPRCAVLARGVIRVYARKAAPPSTPTTAMAAPASGHEAGAPSACAALEGEGEADEAAAFWV